MRMRHVGLATAVLLPACDGAQRSELPRLVTLETGQHAPDDPSISPDGRFIAFTARVRGDDGVYVADPDGRNARLVSQLALDVNDPSWSPDSRSLVYAAAGTTGEELYRVTIEGGTPIQLTQLAADGLGDPLFSPDGSRILFESEHSGRIALWIVPAEGSDPVEVLPGETGNVFHGRWSPDGTRIAMNLGSESGRVVAVLDLAGGAVTRVTHEGMEEFHEWSPDGSELVYVSRRTGAEDIWVVTADGRERRQLTVDVRDDDDPVYSPDGRWIAYVSDRGGQHDLWVVPAAGGEARRVTNDRAIGVNARWSPESDALLFLNIESVRRLYTVPTSGGSLRPITPDSVFSEAPDISPDGRSVVFSGRRDAQYGIYRMPIEGGEEHALVTGSNSFQPSWSPDGSLVAFTSLRGPLPATWVVSVESGEEWQITPEGADAPGGSGWSPDGSRLGYGVRDPGGAMSLFTSSPRGEDVRLVLEGVPLLRSARFSPDGRTVLVLRPTADQDRFGLFRMPVTGGPVAALTTGQRVHEFAPVWSSDGSRIAYTVDSEDAGADVWIMNADGTGKRRLTSSAEQERAMAWAAEDSEVYYLNGLFGVSAVSVATGAIRQVFDGDLAVRDLSFSRDRSMLVVEASPTAASLVRVDLRDLLAREP